MGRRFVQTVLSLAFLLLLQVVIHTRVDWRRLPATFSEVPSLNSNDESAHSNNITMLVVQKAISPQHWWSNLTHHASRTWSPISSNYSWCIPQHSKRLAHHFVRKARDVGKIKYVDGIIFIKSPKAASSTGGVFR